MNEESRPVKAAPTNSAVAAGSVLKSTITSLCNGAIAGQTEPHTLPAPLHDLWRDGFFAGANATRARMQPEIDRLQREADHWYVSAHYSPAEIAEMRRKASHSGGQIDWETGVVA